MSELQDSLFERFHDLLREIVPRQHKQKENGWVAMEDPERIESTRQYYIQFSSFGPAPDRRLFNANMEEHECGLTIYTAYEGFSAHEIDPVCLDDNQDILESITRAVNTQSISGLTYVERDFPPGFDILGESELVEAKSVHYVKHMFRFRYMRAR